jgi:LysM repeat protein
MKKISLWVIILVFTASLAQAQESATQQELDKLSGQIQDLLEAQAQQGKRIDALEKEISDLRDKVNAPVASDYVTRDDLKKIADQVDEIDKKRQDDRDLILAQIEKLGHVTAPAPPPPRHSTSTSTTTTGPGADNTGTPQTGYEYEIKAGDTLGLIAKAYRDQGVKVTKSQIIKANPNMNPNVLIPGKKIFIPDPSAKPAATKE